MSAFYQNLAQLVTFRDEYVRYLSSCSVTIGYDGWHMIEDGSEIVAARTEGYAFPWEVTRRPGSLSIDGPGEGRILAYAIQFEGGNMTWSLQRMEGEAMLLACGLWGNGRLRGLGVMEDKHPGRGFTSEEIRDWWATRRRLEVKFNEPQGEDKSSELEVNWVRYEQGERWIEIKRGATTTTGHWFQVSTVDGQGRWRAWWYDHDFNKVEEWGSGGAGVGDQIPPEVLRIRVGSVEETIRNMWMVWKGMSELLAKI